MNQQKVCVINQQSRALMPTTPRKARVLLKEGRAKIVGYAPFTIELLYGTRGYTQPITLGIDAGFEHIGLSAITEKEELLGGELKMIAGVTHQARQEPLMLEQVRRNKRSMEQFYDAKYIDIRDGGIKPGSELSSGRRTRNKNLKLENLRVYRGKKMSAGQRRIKRTRYPYAPSDLVRFDGKCYQVVGMQNLGTGVKLKNYPGVKHKVVSVHKVQPFLRRGGICEVIN